MSHMTDATSIRELVRTRCAAAATAEHVGVEVTRVYGNEQGCCDVSCTPQATAFQALDAVDGRFVSAFVRATKPTSGVTQ